MAALVLKIMLHVKNLFFFLQVGFYNVCSLEEPGTSHSSKIWHSYEFDTGIGNREGNVILLLLRK